MTAAARALFGAMRLCRNRKLHKLRSGSHAFMPADLCELLDHTVTALPLAAHLHSLDKRARCALGVTDMRSEPRLIETETTRAFGQTGFGGYFRSRPVVCSECSRRADAREGADEIWDRYSGRIRVGLSSLRCAASAQAAFRSAGDFDTLGHPLAGLVLSLLPLSAFLFHPSLSKQAMLSK